MDFKGLVAGLKELKGLTLPSIHAGVEICLMEFSGEDGPLIVKDAKGRLKKRSITEIRKVWDALTQLPAVHVDSVLGGSGSSRNQPETLFANLPFVEFLIVDRKKYIALTQAPTHNPGTIKPMDPVKAEGVRKKLSRVRESPLPWHVVISVADLGMTTISLEGTTGISAKVLSGEPYARQFDLEGTRFLLIGPDPSGTKALPDGTYPLIRGPFHDDDVERIRICGSDLWFKDVLGAKVLIVD